MRRSNSSIRDSSSSSLNCPSPSSNSSSRLSMESLPSPSPKDSTTPIVKLWFQGVDFSPRFRQRTQCRQLLTELHKGKQPEDFLTMIRRGVPQKTARESSATRRTRSFRATISSPRLTSLDRRGQVIEEGAKAAIHSLCISSSTRDWKGGSPEAFLISELEASPEWRNWQTRWTQNLLVLRTVGFDPSYTPSKPKHRTNQPKSRFSRLFDEVVVQTSAS